MKGQNEVVEATKVLTEHDFAVSATALMVKDYLKALHVLDKCEIERVLDLGCGYGGMTKLVTNFFSATEAYGVDINPDRLKVAESRGLHTTRANIDTDKLPFEPDYFDLVISNGVIEHLTFYDNLITESYRLLKKDGHLLITLPNLANYIQRFSLLIGYQPSDVDISKEIYAGTIFFAGKPAQGHIHSATISAMKQLLEYYNFTIVSVKKGDPRMVGPFGKWALLFKIVGYLCPKSLARRIIIIARK